MFNGINLSSGLTILGRYRQCLIASKLLGKLKSTSIYKTFEASENPSEGRFIFEIFSSIGICGTSDFLNLEL
jgi:hypothetical protein